MAGTSLLSVWTAERFGLTPRKISARIAGKHRGLGRVVCNSIPKAGTHLLERALCLHPAVSRSLLPTIHPRNVHRWGGTKRVLSGIRPGRVVVAHLYYDAETDRLMKETDIRCLFMVRDPRDVLVSLAFFAANRRSHRLHRLMCRFPDLGGRLAALLEEQPAIDYPGFPAILLGFAGWLERADAVIRFEDLIGPRGGGDRQRQTAALRRILDLVGLKSDSEQIARAADRLYSEESPTYRKGRIGQWKELFEPHVSRRFDRTCGPLLARFGYE